MKCFARSAAITAALLAGEAGATDAAQVQQHLDLTWLLISAALVFFMQAGFTALETGLVRAKNTINVAIKNLTDFVVSVIGYWLIGFGLMFGTSQGGWFGGDGFMLIDRDTPWDYAFFLFQAVFAGTAATIVAGAVAERMQFRAYIFASAVIAVFIYPVAGHWIWGDGGWLAERGFVDFAGSTVVHACGGWVALAGAWLLGPRLHRFDEQGKPRELQGHNRLLATLGVFILWLGWFGFNGGSVLVADGNVPRVVVNTTLAAAAGGLTTLLFSQLLLGRAKVEELLNGILGGLVGVTASASLVEPWAAALIGVSAGVVVYAADWALLNLLRVDDPIGAIPVHAAAGLWGTLAVALFAPLDVLPAASRLAQLQVQLLGSTAVFAWAFGGGLILFGLLRLLGSLRVPQDHEELGLNVSEHGARTVWFDNMQAMHDIVRNGDLSRRVEEEIGTEAGATAKSFNALMNRLEESMGLIREVAGQLGNAVPQMGAVSEQTSVGVGAQQDAVRQLADSMTAMLGEIQSVAERALRASHAAVAADAAAKGSREQMGGMIETIRSLAEEVQQATATITRLEESTGRIGNVLEVISEVAEQTNLLALNAAIEAARAGESGRGFAVVADEVRTLAQRVQSSASEVQDTIGSVQTQVSESAQQMKRGSEQAMACVSRADDTCRALSQIIDAVTDISGMNADIAAAAERQSQAAAQIEAHTRDIDAVASEAAAGASETARLGGDVGVMVDRLDSLVAQYRVLH